MSKIDAKDALEIYRHFCKETERVVEYLGVAKKLQNLLNVPIPNLRHVSQLAARKLSVGHGSYPNVTGPCVPRRRAGGIPERP